MNGVHQSEMDPLHGSPRAVPPFVFFSEEKKEALPESRQTFGACVY